MDDETVERILSQMEKKFGEYRMEQGAKYSSFGKILIDKYMTGQSKGTVKQPDGSVRIRNYDRGDRATTKQRSKLFSGMRRYYGDKEDENQQ